MTTLSPDRHLEHKLRTAWHRHRLRSHAYGFAHVAGWTVGLFLAFFVLDRLLLLALPARMALLAATLGCLATVLIRRWVRGLIRYDRKSIAAAFERAHPELLGLLRSYVELAGSTVAHVHGSDALKTVVYDQAIAAAEPISVRDTVDLRSVIPTLAAGICALLVGTAVVMMWSDLVHIFARRLLGDPITYPTRTSIVSITGDRTVKQGDSLDLFITVRGIVPDEALLRIKVPGADWQSIELSPAQDDRFTHRIEALTSSFIYSVECGDAHSAEYTILVIPPPTILKARVTIHPPPYTQLPSYDLKTLNVEVPEQSRVEWMLEYDTALSAASFLGGVKAPEEVSIGPDGHSVTFSRVATEPLTYQLRTTRRDTGFEYNSTQHRVYLRPDTRPDVSILSPSGNIQATVNKTLPVQFRAKDDYGIAQAWLVYSLNEGKESRIELGQLPSVSGQENTDYPRYGVWPFVWDLKYHVPDLQIGDAISFSIEVADVRARPESAVVHRSQPRMIRVVSYSAYQGHILAHLTAVQERLVDVHVEARKSKQALEALRKLVARQDGD